MVGRRMRCQPPTTRGPGHARWLLHRGGCDVHTPPPTFLGQNPGPAPTTSCYGLFALSHSMLEIPPHLRSGQSLSSLIESSERKSTYSFQTPSQALQIPFLCYVMCSVFLEQTHIFLQDFTQNSGQQQQSAIFTCFSCKRKLSCDGNVRVFRP